MKIAWLSLLALVAVSGLRAQAPAPELPWDLEAMAKPPEEFASPAIQASDPRIRAVFFAGPDYRGKPTRVFAWLGVPEVPAGKTVPGIVLLHGGGGTAFESWVKLWLDRGYAAIAIDSFGGLPVPLDAKPRPRNPDGGPPGGSLAFQQLGEPLGDQWPRHAIAAAISAHSLLRVQPGVDPARIGVTGISWGGYLTCIFAGVDSRLRFAAPVYGCGHYGDTTFAGTLKKLPPAKAAIWWEHWDASLYLPRVRVPILWANGTNDHFFWLPAWRQSYRQTPTALRTLCLRPGMKHGHPPEGDPREITVFADSIVRGGEPLPAIVEETRSGDRLEVRFRAVRPVVRAELVFTLDDTSPWEKRVWQSQPAELAGSSARARLPAGVRGYFLNLTDDRGCLVSSEPRISPDEMPLAP